MIDINFLNNYSYYKNKMNNENVDVDVDVDVKVDEKVDENKTKSILVLSGGGIKGLIYIGIFKYFEEINIMKNIDTFVGASAGALFSVLYSIGYTSKQLYQFV